MIEKKYNVNRVTAGGLLITLGIIYGDIGTSPLYVLQAIIGQGDPRRDVILGGLSCIFWTLTMQTTLKYVIFTLRADNKGEGGIFSLYALVRKAKAGWLVLPAIIGGSTLLADGIITPSISISSAVEGLRLVYPDIKTIPIVLSILAGLFLIQQFGTRLIGFLLGPLMLVWFLMIGILGISALTYYPGIIQAVNPSYAYQLLAEHPGGFWLLGAVFLCTTGAEALYSDLGHCGKTNIRITWVFVKAMLLINYFGQGAWLLSKQDHVGDVINPFFALMPKEFLFTGIIIATLAAIIASQALISGSYTLINEAIRLNFWPKIRIKYPTNFKGQLYIPSVNWLLLAGCVAIVLYFRESSNMEAAYGLAIVLTMIMTSLLLSYYMKLKKYPVVIIMLILTVYLSIEFSFLAACLVKLVHGGWITLLIASLLAAVMWTMYSARKIKNRQTEFVSIEAYYPRIVELISNEKIDKITPNLVFLTSADMKHEIESTILDSILDKHPKRADAYWFLHIDVLDEPYAFRYDFTELIPDKLIKIDFHLGFRVEPRIRLLFRRVLEDLVMLNKKVVIGDFSFIVLDRKLQPQKQVNIYEKMMLRLYTILKKLSLSEGEAFGLDLSKVTVEEVNIPVLPRAGSLGRR